MFNYISHQSFSSKKYVESKDNEGENPKPFEELRDNRLERLQKNKVLPIEPLIKNMCYLLNLLIENASKN